MTIERIPLELKLAGAGEDATFSGIASTFGGVDRHGDTIAPGAYAKTLGEHKAAGTVPALLWAHDPSEPIGVIDALEEGPAGLTIKGRLADTARGRDARTLARMGAVSGLSIGFRTRKAATGPNGTRILEDIDLVEISFVASPADPRARLSAIKAADAAERAVDMTAQTTGAAPDNVALEAKMADLALRLEAAETALARPAIITGKADDATPEQKAFASFARKGLERMPADETKDLRVSDDGQGGYLAPAQFVAELIRNVVLFSPIRQAARIASTASSSVILPRRTGAMTAGWVGETEDRPETQPTYGQLEFPIHEMACYVDVSNRLLEDAAVNLESELAFDFGEEFGRGEGAAFITGDGVKKPLGLLGTPGIVNVRSGQATALPSTPDTFIDLFHALPAPYRADAAWGMNSRTIAGVRKYKASTGEYLWSDSLSADRPQSFLGRPVIEMPDLPDVAAGTRPIVFGDFTNFRIFDRVSLSILRNPYVLADKGLVRFHGRRRVGGGVTRTEAFRFLEIGV